MESSTSFSAGMSFQFERVEALSVRDEVVEFLWEHKRWPWPTIEDYYAAWDWRFTSISDGAPVVLLARVAGTGRIAGHIAVYRRRFRIAGRELTIGVPGDLFSTPESRGTVVGPRLASLPRSLVRSGEVDAVIAYANPTAHPLFLRLGFRDLGLMHPFTQVRRWTAVIRRKLSIAAPLGPVLDATWSAWRWSRAGGRSSGREHSVREVSAEEFLGLSRRHWVQRPERLVANDTAEYVVRRYLKCPFAARRLFGLFDSGGTRLDGYVVAEGDDRRVVVSDCQASGELALSEVIEQVVRSVPGVATVVIPTLPDSLLAGELKSAGYLHRKPTDYVDSTTHVSAYWLESHPLAGELAQVQRWNLWLGSNHY